MPRSSDSTSPPGRREEITELLGACSHGDPKAFDRLIPLVYDDLRAIAHRRLSFERADHTLDTTALVHEAYVKLADQTSSAWSNRAHFFAVSARVIRHLLIDYARERRAAKRGGGAIILPLSEEIEGEPEQTVDLLALDEALSELGRREARLERVVEYRFFGGMTIKETAKALDVSISTAERDWRRARAYLYSALS